ncbi:uncharacterized protein LOC112555897 [Pomacea canaliculata]|uniref:uncharacterized protein LOC112555897 n=1 Tax=Pomacea canaliculata TaxID=400727 RepID=UPI000D72C6AE|nr:uncharacterized protein LOC112555897 [Pomacea canaliculata]
MVASCRTLGPTSEDRVRRHLTPTSPRAGCPCTRCDRTARQTSVGTVEEVTSKSRRKSAGSRSVAGSDMSAATRKASTISLTATAIDSSQSLASRATLASVDIPLDFLQQPVTRLNTVLRPVLMLVLVLTLAASLGAALYFAVVLNRAQAREIAYLRATLRLPLQESEYQSLVVQPSSQKEEFGQEFCKWIDQRYQTSVLASKYRGCRVSSLDHQRVAVPAVLLQSAERDVTRGARGRHHYRADVICYQRDRWRGDPRQSACPGERHHRLVADRVHPRT